MDWLWILQLGINLIVVTALFVWWKERATPAAMGSAALDMEVQARQWEQEAEVARKKTEDQLRFLVLLCEQANAILLRHGGDPSVATASLEEQELKELRKPQAHSAFARAIPSVQELEVRKQAVRLEIPMDLRSLLRDQLT